MKSPAPITTIFDIDEAAIAIKEKYLDTPAAILAQKELDSQREQLKQWIIDPANDVKVIIAFSGGKDSISMVLYTIFVLGIDRSRIELWHHEVDGGGDNLFDWKCTPSYCKAFADAFGVDILFSYAKGGIKREMYRENETIQPVYFQEVMGGPYTEVMPVDDERFRSTRRKFPAASKDLGVRWCSWIAKIGIMNKAINNMDKYRDANIVIMTGERRAEGGARTFYNEIEPYRSFTKTRRAITWRPIIDWSLAEVWGIIKKHKVQPHPCYELGWGRCSCQLCIFSQPNTWAAINEVSPEKVEQIAAIEKDLGQTMYASREKGTKAVITKNIYETMVDKGQSFIPKEAKDRWLQEALSEFVSPIIVDNWVAPAGAFSVETNGAN